MKDCSKAKKLLCRYLDKETNARDTSFVEEHVKICPACKKELSEFSRVKEVVSGRERKILPENYLVFRLREKAARGNKTAQKIPALSNMGRLSLRFIPVPAATIIVSVVFLFFTSSEQPVKEYSLEDNILSGTPVTTETVLELILGGTEIKSGGGWDE